MICNGNLDSFHSTLRIIGRRKWMWYRFIVDLDHRCVVGAVHANTSMIRVGHGHQTPSPTVGSWHSMILNDRGMLSWWGGVPGLTERRTSVADVVDDVRAGLCFTKKPECAQSAFALDRNFAAILNSITAQPIQLELTRFGEMNAERLATALHSACCVHCRVERKWR